MTSTHRLTFNDLPQDVLVLVLSYLDIWDVFSARLVNKSLQAVLLSSIRTISRQVCLNTFPNDRQLARKPANGSGEWDFDWLRDRIPRKLAAILLEHGERSIPAEAEWGEVARYRVTRGWKVLKQLSIRYREVYEMDEDTVMRYRLMKMESSSNSSFLQPQPQQKGENKERTSETIFHEGRLRRLAEKTKNLLHPDLSVLEAREELALAKCRQHISTLRRCDALGFMLLWDRLVCGPFRTEFAPYYDSLHEDCIGRRRCLCPSYCGTLAQGIGTDERDSGQDERGSGGDNVVTLERGNCWMTWLILRNGPRIFFRQWYSQEGQYRISDTAYAAWKSRSKHQVELERNVAARIWASVWMRAWSQKNRKKHSPSSCPSSSGSTSKAAEPFSPSRVLRPEYLWWDDSISQGGLGSSAMPWVSFIFEEQPMWQELYDDYGSQPIRGQVLWLLWQQRKITIDEDFDAEAMLASTEDVDDLLEAYWLFRFNLRGSSGMCYPVGTLPLKGRRARLRRMRQRSMGGGGDAGVSVAGAGKVGKVAIKLYEWAILPRRFSAFTLRRS